MTTPPGPTPGAAPEPVPEPSPEPVPEPLAGPASERTPERTPDPEPDPFDDLVLDENFVRGGTFEPPARTRLAIARYGDVETSWRHGGGLHDQAARDVHPRETGADHEHSRACEGMAA